MNEEIASPRQSIAYLLKIVAILSGLAALVMVAMALPTFALQPEARYGLLAVFIFAVAGIVPFVRRVYLKMDELHRLLHQSACVASMSLVVAVSGIMGILQANDVIPAFSQFWTMAMVIGVWATNLMLADRRHR